jgi:hypothetical protein
MAVKQNEKFNPFPAMTGGWVAVPHSFGKLLEQEKVSGTVQLLLLFQILVDSVGDGEKPEWVTGWTAEKFAKRVGCSPIAAELALADLAKRGLIEREKDGRSWKYKASPENWDAAPTTAREGRDAE